ncbi:MAG: gamma-glutamyl-gamma-aminobutyrate hydrolase family protein [Aeromicrobium sp.]
MRTYVVFDEITGKESGFVGEQLVARGSELHYVDRMELPTFQTLEDPGLVLILGSHLAAHDPVNAELVEAESQFARDALDAGVPVMAICYGAQLLARALGGTSYRAPAPEVGWQLVETSDQKLCPSGPWAQLHSDVFEAPPTSTLIGKSAAGHQCFTDESRNARAIAWQFHPEVPVDVYDRWIDEDEGYYREFGTDTDALKLENRERAEVAQEAAHRLTDSALDWLQQG